MKNVLRLLIIAALAAAFALPALAQGTPSAGAAGPCTQDADAKAALYKKFLDSYKGSPDQQKAASEAGKEYLTKYGNCPDEADKKIASFIQNWVGKYEKATVEFNCTDAVNKNPTQAFQLCKPIIEQNPDNLKIYLMLVAAGVKNAQSGSKSLNAEAANAARKALDLIGQGKTTDSWAPFTNQQEAAAGLHYYVGFFSLDNTPEETATQLLQAAQSNTSFSKEPSTYQLLGAAYYNGEFNKLAAQYKACCEGKEETPESKALYDKINYSLDRIIDAYARAVALSGTNPKYAAITSKVKPVLTSLYKQRHDNSDAGLNELLASVLNKPLPLPGQEPAPTSTPSSSSGTTGTDGTGTTPKPAATPATNPGAKPATTPTTKPATTPAKPSNPPQKPPVTKATPAARSRAATTSGR
jgi:hypothetical protein